MLSFLLDLIFRKYLYRDRHERRIGVYYPSEIGFCIRSLWYAYKYPRELPMKTLLLFESGISAHEWLTKVLTETKTIEIGSDIIANIEVIPEGEVEYKVDDGVMVRGRFDELLHIRFNKNGKTYDSLIELKTARDIKKIREVKLHHYMQINFYMKVLGIEQGYVMYLDRKDYNYKIFEVKLNEKLFQELIDRVKYLHYCLKYNQIPEPEGTKPRMRWMCIYCQYNDICKVGLHGMVG